MHIFINFSLYDSITNCICYRNDSGEKGDNSAGDAAKAKPKGFLNFFSKKTNKKRDEAPASEPAVSKPDQESGADSAFESVGRRSDRSSKDRNAPKQGVDQQRSRHKPNEKSQNRSQDRMRDKSQERLRDKSHEKQNDRSYERQGDRSHERIRDRPHERIRDRSQERIRVKTQEMPGDTWDKSIQDIEHPQKKQEHIPNYWNDSQANNQGHNRSKSTDFYRDRDIAMASGLGYIVHGPVRNDYDRRSNHSTHSSRSRTNRDAYVNRPYQGSQQRDERYLDSMTSNPQSKFRYGRSSPASLADLDRIMHTPSAPPSFSYHSNGNLRNDVQKGNRYYSNTLDHRDRIPLPNLPPPISQFAGRSNGEQLSDV